MRLTDRSARAAARSPRGCAASCATTRGRRRRRCVLRGRAPAHVDPSYFARTIRSATPATAACASRSGSARSPKAGRSDASQRRAWRRERRCGHARARERDQLQRLRQDRRSPTGAIPALVVPRICARRCATLVDRAARGACRRLIARCSIACVAVATAPRRAAPRTLPTDQRIMKLGGGRSAARRAAVPVRPLPADRQQPPRIAARQPAGHLERRAARAVELELHDQHQHAR